MKDIKTLFILIVLVLTLTIFVTGSNSVVVSCHHEPASKSILDFPVTRSPVLQGQPTSREEYELQLAKRVETQAKNYLQSTEELKKMISDCKIK